jgi:cobalamin biosynthesis Co2+ chelatase CbiK
MLTACSSPPSPTTQTNPAPAATPSAASLSNKLTEQPKEQSPKTVDVKAELAGLQEVVAKTTTAVNASNFDNATAEFKKFETHWSKVEDSVKAKSAQTYKNIEDHTDTITNGLKAKKPDPATVLVALKSLSHDIEVYASSR